MSRFAGRRSTTCSSRSLVTHRSKTTPATRSASRWERGDDHRRSCPGGLVDRGQPSPAHRAAQHRVAPVLDDPADHVRGPVRVRLRRLDPGRGLRELLPVPVARDLQPDDGVQLGVHGRRPRRGPPKGPHRPSPVTPDGAVGGAHRAHGVRSRAQHVHVLRDARRRVPDRVPLRGEPRRGGRGDAPAAALQLLPELGAGADRALGEVGGGRQLGRVHLDVPDDVRVVGVRRPEHDARLARADRRTRTRSRR